MSVIGIFLQSRLDQIVERTNELEFRKRQLESENKKLEIQSTQLKERLNSELLDYQNQLEVVVHELSDLQLGTRLQLDTR